MLQAVWEQSSLTMSVNSWSGTNSITGVQTICSGAVPTTLNNDQAPTADLGGATIVYQWQSRTATNPFVDIPGNHYTNICTFGIINHNILPSFGICRFNGSTCPSTVASATSNIVTVTVDANSVPTISFTSGYANDTMCDGDTVIF